MLRIVAYSAGPLMIIWSILFLILVLVLYFASFSYNLVQPLVILPGLAAGVLSLAYYVAPGIRVYAQLPRARFVAAVTAFLSFLFCFTLIMLWYVGY
jgi:hypothetical protein